MQTGNSAKKQTLSIVLVIAIVVAACISIWYLKTGYIYDAYDFKVVESEDGVWDLTGIDFEDSFVRANGSVEYIAGALLTPEEFEQRETEAGIGWPEDVANVSTSRITLRVPEGKVYAIAGDSINYNARVYVNGALRLTAGNPAETKEKSKAGHDFMYIQMEPVDGVIEIVQQSSNFAHRDGTSHSGFRFGSAEVMQRYVNIASGMSSAVMWIFGTLFFVHLILFLFFRSFRANLYFALLCLTWFFRAGVTDVKVILEMFPSFPWEAAFRMEYISIPLACLFMVLMLAQLFPGLLKRWFVRTVAVVSAVFAVLYLFLDTFVMSQSLIVFEALYGVAILVVAIRLLHSARRYTSDEKTRAEYILTLAGTLIFLYAAIHDAFYYNGIYLFGLNESITDMALMVFAFLQMTAVFYGTMISARTAWEEQRLAMEEAGRLREEASAREALVSSIPAEHLLSHGPLVLNALSGQAFLRNSDMLLTPKEFALLLWLMQHEGEYFGAEELYRRVWQQEPGGSTGALTTAVSRLRKKLEVSGGAVAIHSRRGSGYMFVYTPKP